MPASVIVPYRSQKERKSAFFPTDLAENAFCPLRVEETGKGLPATASPCLLLFPVGLRAALCLSQEPFTFMVNGIGGTFPNLPKKSGQRGKVK